MNIPLVCCHAKPAMPAGIRRVMDNYEAELRQPVSPARVHEMAQAISALLCAELDHLSPEQEAAPEAECMSRLLQEVTDFCCRLMFDEQRGGEALLSLLVGCRHAGGDGKREPGGCVLPAGFGA